MISISKQWKKGLRYRRHGFSRFSRFSRFPLCSPFDSSPCLWYVETLEKSSNVSVSDLGPVMDLKEVGLFWCQGKKLSRFLGGEIWTAIFRYVLNVPVLLELAVCGFWRRLYCLGSGFSGSLFVWRVGHQHSSNCLGIWALEVLSTSLKKGFDGSLPCSGEFLSSKIERGCLSACEDFWFFLRRLELSMLRRWLSRSWVCAWRVRYRLA